MINTAISISSECVGHDTTEYIMNFYGVKNAMGQYMSLSQSNFSHDFHEFFAPKWHEILKTHLANAIWCSIFNEYYYVKKQKEGESFKLADKKMSEFLKGESK